MPAGEEEGRKQFTRCGKTLDSDLILERVGIPSREWVTKTILQTAFQPKTILSDGFRCDVPSKQREDDSSADDEPVSNKDCRRMFTEIAKQKPNRSIANQP